MDSGMVPEDLVQRWQAAYSEYLTEDRLQTSAPNPVKMARLAAAVAAAWRDLASVPGLPWWLVASLTTSAEAFERQARWDRSRAVPDRPTERGSGPRPLPQDEAWSGSLGPDGPGFGGRQ
jgi:hypothetical protein